MRKYKNPGICPIFIWVLFVASAVNLSKAQTDFRPGYFIYPSGDSVHALINFAKSEVCEFKIQDQKKILTADEIIGFGFANDRYYSASILPGQFTEVIVEGYLSLYKSKEIYFIRKQNDTLIKLERIKPGGNDAASIARQNADIRWKGILRFVLKDCEKTNVLIDQMRFSESDFTELVIEYNKCLHQVYKEFKSILPGLKISPGVGLGAAYSIFELKHGETVITIPTKFRSIDPFPMIFLNFYSPRISSKISIQAELQWKWIKTDGELIIQNSTQGITRSTSVNLSFLSLPLYLKYTLPMDNKNLAFYFGFMYDQILHQKTKLVTEDRKGSQVTTTTLIDPYDFGLPQFGISSGVSFGVVINKLLMSLRGNYSAQGLTASGVLDKGGRFETKFRSSTPFNRFSLGLTVQRK